MPGAKKKPSSLPQVSLMGVPMQRRRLIRGQMPAWNFNFRVTTLLAGKPASQPLPENRRAFPVNGGIPAAITRRKRLSPRLLTGDGLPVPCCRFAPANGSLKAVIRGSRVLLKAFDEGCVYNRPILRRCQYNFVRAGRISSKKIDAPSLLRRRFRQNANAKYK